MGDSFGSNRSSRGGAKFTNSVLTHILYLFLLLLQLFRDTSAGGTIPLGKNCEKVERMGFLFRTEA